MISYPLTRPHRIQLARVFPPPHVDISIDCVIEDQMGKAYVDSVENPQLYMIELDGFFCYFGGDVTSTAGRAFVSKTPHGRMLMAGSDGWQEVVRDVFSSDQLIVLKRYTYASDSLSLDHVQKLISGNAHTSNVRRIDATLASTDIPYFEIGSFESPQDFEQRGIGFCLMQDGKSLGVAYSSLVCSRAIEVSIVVDPDYYRQGIATALACHLLQWCLQNHVSPHWDAANEESCFLAEKLGYKKQGEYGASYLK